jgi:hypothetical protein
MRPNIGSHHSLQDPRYWRFERTSGLPRSAFAEPHRGDRWVFVTCIVILAGLIAALGAGWL